MKTYLKSQYHMDPLPIGLHRPVLCDNFTHAVLMRPHVGSAEPRVCSSSLLDRYRDVLIAAGASRRRFAALHMGDHGGRTAERVIVPGQDLDESRSPLEEPGELLDAQLPR